MKQLTIRGFGKELERAIRNLARSEHISLNQAALRLLSRGAGLDKHRHEEEHTVGASLDHLIGTWSEEEAQKVMEAVADFETIDESLWR
jgi:hypothetical protein